jgi:hypothetical protein
LMEEDLNEEIFVIRDEMNVRVKYIVQVWL